MGRSLVPSCKERDNLCATATSCMTSAGSREETDSFAQTDLTACCRASVSLSLQLRHADVGSHPLLAFEKTIMEPTRMACRNESYHPSAFASHDHSAPVRSISAHISASIALQIAVAALISALILPRLCEPYMWLLACRVVVPAVA
jgi:hypothetical protein